VGNKRIRHSVLQKKVRGTQTRKGERPGWKKFSGKTNERRTYMTVEKKKLNKQGGREKNEQTLRRLKYALRKEN